MRLLAPSLLFLLTWAAVCQARINVELCRMAYEDLSGIDAPPDSPFVTFEGAENVQARNFFLSTFLPVVGMRGLRDSSTGYRQCEAGAGCISIGPGEKGPQLRVVWTNSVKEPRVGEAVNDVRTLYVPKGFDFESLPDGGEGILKRFLIGHELHPNLDSENIILERLVLGEDGIHLKQIQEHGRDAAIDAIEKGDSSFLFVGPTGSGKSIVAEAVLQHQVQRHEALRKSRKPTERKKGRKLHVVMADKNFLVKQLAGDVAPVDAAKKPRILEWRSDRVPQDGEPRSIEELLLQVDDYDGPTILVTNVRSLVDRIKGSENDIGEVRSRLATIVFDEAHHAGAEGTAPVLKELLDKDQGSHAFLYGTTATPTHREVNLIESVFGNRAYWAYLDTPETYRSGNGTLDRKIGDIVQQLRAGIEQGELSPFTPHWIDPYRFQENTGMPLFESSKRLEAWAAGLEDAEDLLGNRFVLNPNQYGNVVSRLDPLFARHEQGFIVAADITEARDFTASLKTKYGDTKPGPNGEQMFATLHSDMPKGEKEKIMADFKSGKIRFLVTVRMLDEGINVPGMSLYVDLTHDPPAKQLIQRIGRVLRISEGKYHPAEVVTFRDIHDEQTAQALVALDDVGTPGGGGGGGEGQHERGTPSLFEDVKWTPEELRAAERQFFTDSGRGVERAREEARRLIRFFETFARPLDGIEHLQTDRVDPNDRVLNVAERTLHESLATRLDSARANAPGNVAFFEALSQTASPKVKAGLEAFKQVRAQRREQMKTALGTADVVTEFLSRHKRYPRSKDSVHETVAKPTSDEDEIAAALSRFRGELEFILEFEKHIPRSDQAGLFRRFLDRPAVELHSPVRVAEWVDDFWGLFHRLPDQKAPGFEGELARAMKLIQDPAADLKDEDAALALMMVRDEASRPAAPPRDTFQPSRPTPEVVPVGDTAPAHLRTALRDRILDSLNSRIAAFGNRFPPERNTLEGLRDKYQNHKEQEAIYRRALPRGDVAEINHSALALDDLSRELSLPINLTPLIPNSSRAQRMMIKTGGAGKSQETATLSISGNPDGSRALGDFYKGVAKELNYEVKESFGPKGQLVLEIKGQGALSTFELERLAKFKIQYTGAKSKTFTNELDVRVLELGDTPSRSEVVRTYRFQNGRPVVTDGRIGSSYEGRSDAEALGQLYNALRLHEIQQLYPTR